MLSECQSSLTPYIFFSRWPGIIRSTSKLLSLGALVKHKAGVGEHETNFLLYFIVSVVIYISCCLWTPSLGSCNVITTLPTTLHTEAEIFWKPSWEFRRISHNVLFPYTVISMLSFFLLLLCLFRRKTEFPLQDVHLAWFPVIAGQQLACFHSGPCALDFHLCVSFWT